MLRIRDLTGIPIECWDSTYVTARSARRAWGNKGLPLGRAKHLALAEMSCPTCPVTGTLSVAKKKNESEVG